LRRGQVVDQEQRFHGARGRAGRRIRRGDEVADAAPAIDVRDRLGDDVADGVAAFDDRNDPQRRARAVARREHGAIGGVEPHSLGHKLLQGLIAERARERRGRRDQRQGKRKGQLQPSEPTRQTAAGHRYVLTSCYLMIRV
jgi:hypothetical protein